MDVRCPRCETEYELDESRLRPGGVTVKCASCEHVFRVRKRANTQTGAPPPPRASQAPPMDDDEDEKTWLIRKEDGEIKTCRELATLQKWIVSGKVSRACEISRTGKTWKVLGEIVELDSFFAIADEARAVASGKRPAPDVGPVPAVEGSMIAANPLHVEPSPSGAHPRAVPREQLRARTGAPITEGTATVQLSLEDARRPYDEAEAEGDIETLELSPIEARAPLGNAAADEDAVTDPRKTLLGTGGGPSAEEVAAQVVEARAKAQAAAPKLGQTVPSTPAAVRAAGPAASAALAAEPTPAPEPAPAAAPAERPAAAEPALRTPDGERKTAGWASQGMPGSAAAAGPSGPVGGLARGVPTDEAAFVAGGRAKPKTSGAEFQGGRFVATDALLDDEPLRPAGSRAALWVALASLVLLAGASAVIYLFVFRGGGDEPSVAAGQADAAAIAAGDAGTALAAADAGAADLALLASAEEALRAGDVNALEDARDELGLAPESADTLAVRARIESALAQALRDQRLFVDGASERQLREKAAEHAKAANELATRALELDEEHLGAQVAKADAMRLLGAAAREVERRLREPLRSSGPMRSEAALVKGMLLERDDRHRDARAVFEEIRGAEGDLRPQYRIALLAFADEEYEDAAAAARKVAAVAPNHPASALAERATELAAAEDPMPPEVPPGTDPDEVRRPDEHPLDTYDRLLQRGNELAVNGQCGEAMKVYARALDLNPSGVAALTGLGYCHMDAGQYASAQARFRAALGISPRYQDALWGVAETHLQQGQRDEAIAAFRRFIEQHPTSRRAEMARRQIDRLGGNDVPEPEDPAVVEPDPGQSGTEEAPDGTDVIEPETGDTDVIEPEPGDGF